MAASAPASTQSADSVWTLSVDDALRAAGSTANGLTSAEAAARLARYGPNTIEDRKKSDSLSLLLKQFTSPIVLILVVATIISGVLGDVTDTVIILAIIVVSGLLGFWQERGATQGRRRAARGGPGQGRGPCATVRPRPYR